ncbi:MAG: HD domain-containing protein [bacterium]
MEIPQAIKQVIADIENGGFEAYLVGGCVRDFLLDKKPADWDIATNASPQDIEKVIQPTGRETFYENDFWTVGVVCPELAGENDSNNIVEITTYRAETTYSDKRHPDKVTSAKNLEEDLSRRDFTINAMALKLDKTDDKLSIVDLYRGKEDLRDKIIRAVGNPEDRFNEDALRMLRAVRFSTSLGFIIEPETKTAIKTNRQSLKLISQERIRDELVKIISSSRADQGIESLRELGLLEFIIPELEEGYGVGQNKHHIFDCYQHNLLSLKYAAEKDFNFNVRMATLLHDIGKPRTKAGDGPDSTFHNHETVGARMAKVILERLKFSKKDIQKIVTLVRYHLFYYNVGEVTESSVRRLVRNVGPENIDELLEVRMADRIGSGVPKAEPYKLRHLRYLIDRVAQDPLSAKMLAVNGNDVITVLNIQPGPRVGFILEILLGEVLSDPKNNDKELLLVKVKKLNELTDNELREMVKKAKNERESLEMKRDEMTKNRYWVT